MRESQLVGFRRRAIGFIFQAFGLLPILSAAENVEVPLRLVGTEPGARQQRVHELLELVGLADRANHRPMSSRVASSSGSRSPGRWPIEPRCCSPTSRPASWTRRPGAASWRCSSAWCASEGLTAIVATHDPTLIDVADRVIELQDGQVVEGDRPAA